MAREVTLLLFHTCRLEDHDACSALEHVDLSGCSSITDVGLIRLARCLSLRHDTSSHDLFKDGDESIVGCMPSAPTLPLHGVRQFCSGCPFRDLCNGVVSLSSAGNELSDWELSDYLLFGCNLSSKGTPCCAQKREPVRKATSTGGLSSLNLSGCFKITDEGLLYLTDNDLLSRLEFLDVSGCFQLTGAGLRELMLGTPRLLPENLFYCDYVDGGPFQETANGCQNLQCFSRACCRSGQ